MGMAIDTGVANCQVALTLQVALSCLYGFFLVEAQAYFSRFPKDRLAFKLLVLWLLGLQTFYYGVRFAGAFHSVNELAHGRPDVGQVALYGLMSVAITTLVEATTEGWFVFRLWRVTKRWWMRIISLLLWTFSTTAHVVWIGIAAAEGKTSVVGRSKQSLIVMLAFWGTFAEGSFVASCLLYELQFARDRRMIAKTGNSTISQLVSLALRTSGVLVIFELVVAIAVSIQAQPAFALVTEIDYAACLYTCLAGIVVIYSLNYRSVMRRNPNGDIPSLRAPSTSGFNGPGPSTARRNSHRPRQVSSGGAIVGLGVLAIAGEKATTLSAGLSGKRSGDSKERERGFGVLGGGRRASTFTGQISVSQTVSQVETQLSPEGDLAQEDCFLGPGGWSHRLPEVTRPPPALQ